MEVLNKILESLKLSLSNLFICSVALGLLLFAPADKLQIVGIYDFVTTYRNYISITWYFVSLVFVLKFSGSFLVIAIVPFLTNLLETIKIKRKLKSLNGQEKNILKQYLINDTNSLELPLNDGTVNELAANGIIYRSSIIGRLISGFSYNIDPWAKKYLEKNTHILSDK